ncbi:hypothetical protein ACINK0_11375 [Deinococcus sp. VB343]|uniref:Uncharacterized protein n=1 Tax=Deinococcus sp. VB142 TaxID=3112952 RepID=A0AAU6Q826_9DEIO
MPEKPLIATHLLGAFALVGAGIVQLGIILMLGVRFKPGRVIGALIVACFIGGGSAMILQEYLHWNSFISGVVGTGTGLIPAALSTSVITRKALERAGVDPTQLKEMRQIIQDEADQSKAKAEAEAEVKTDA